MAKTQALKEAQKRYQQKRFAEIRRCKMLGIPLPPLLQKLMDTRKVAARRRREKVLAARAADPPPLKEKRESRPVWLPIDLMKRVEATAVVKGVRRHTLVADMIEYWYEQRGEFDDRR